MRIVSSAAVIVLATIFLSGLTARNAWGQQTSAPAITNQGAAYEAVLDQADEEDPSASHELLDDGQTLLGLLWGFSAKIEKRTTLDAEFKYQKALSSRFGTPKLHNLGVEAILTQAFTERLGEYLASENYYEFSIHGYMWGFRAMVNAIPG
jgi:hypothetical protein